MLAPSDIDHGITLGFQRSSTFAESWCDRPTKFAHQCSIAGHHGFSICIPSDAAAGQGLDVARNHRVEATHCRRRCDGVAEAMF